MTHNIFPFGDLPEEFREAITKQFDLAEMSQQVESDLAENLVQSLDAEGLAGLHIIIQAAVESRDQGLINIGRIREIFYHKFPDHCIRHAIVHDKSEQPDVEA